MQTEEEEGVGHSRYLASHGEQESSEEESQRHQMREDEREMLAAAPRSIPDRGSQEQTSRPTFYIELKHREPIQSLWVAGACYFIVNVLDLPFASPIAIYR